MILTAIVDIHRSTFAAFACGGVLLIAGCATSMTPSQFNSEFPKATSSKFYDRKSSREAISKRDCKLLFEGRKYTSPIGLSVHGDVENGALGVDEWVKADGGNAYALTNFEWISVGRGGATQLVLYFDTMLCK
jgi:hypothetical protein